MDPSGKCRMTAAHMTGTCCMHDGATLSSTCFLCFLPFCLFPLPFFFLTLCLHLSQSLLIMVGTQLHRWMGEQMRRQSVQDARGAGAHSSCTNTQSAASARARHPAAASARFDCAALPCRQIRLLPSRTAMFSWLTPLHFRASFSVLCLLSASPTKPPPPRPSLWPMPPSPCPSSTSCSRQTTTSRSEN